MGTSLNGTVTGQQKLLAIQAKGYYKDVPSFDESDGVHQYEIALKYDQLVASGDIVEAAIPGRTGTPGFSNPPNVVTDPVPQGSPIPNVAPTAASNAGTTEYD